MNRIVDFVNFHNQSCRSDSITIPFKRYCELKGFNKRYLELATIFYALTYCTASAIVLLSKYDELTDNAELFWKNNKDLLLFQSDRKYVKMNDMFVPALEDFLNKGVFEYLDRQEKINVEEFVRVISNVRYFGRFSSFLFLDCYDCLFDKTSYNNKLNWYEGSTVTSGMFNVLGEDDKANLWDREHKLKLDLDLFNSYADELLDKVSLGKDLATLQSNLCAYRKLFKQSRYIGYYTDRVLEECNIVFRNYPEYKSDYDLLLEARRQTVSNEYLGELNGWNGIRNDLKKFYSKHGYWDWTLSNNSLF